MITQEIGTHPCKACHGDGKVEVATCGHYSLCPCDTKSVWCDACEGFGQLTDPDCECSICETVREDLGKQAIQ